MDIDPHKSLNPLPGSAKTGPTGSKKRVRKSSLASSQSANEAASVFSGSELQEVIRKSLDSMPEVRRQLVETGRELAEDENYPSAEALDELSRLALRHFDKERYDAS